MDKLIELVTNWYMVNHRDIPWRKEPTAYHVWLSEIMCQQTRVETVIPYYLRFIEALPSIEDLAQVEDDELMKLWQGLGYYSRARNLKKSAQIIMDKYNGIFPQQYQQVLDLPGIGEYTAGAILSMAFQQNYAAVDGNFLRVLTRYYKDSSDISEDKVKKKYKQLIEEKLVKQASEFNQGMMDLGASICIPNGAPKCDLCPLQSDCKAHLTRNELSYPEKSNKLKKKDENYTVFIIEKDDQIVLHKRSSKGLLANLYEFPNVEGFLSRQEIINLFNTDVISKEQAKDFVFSHKIWHMNCYRIKVNDYILKDNEVFASPEEMESIYSIPQAFKKIIEKD